MIQLYATHKRRGFLSHGHRVSGCKIKGVLKMGCGKGCTMLMHLMLLKCTTENRYDSKCFYVYFTTINKVRKKRNEVLTHNIPTRMNPENIMLREESRTQLLWFHSYEMSRIGKSIAIENKSGLIRGWERKKGECLPMGTQFLLGVMKMI